jgi:anti-sigma-K factor RskA
MSDASIHDLAAGYSLDALDEPDRSAFEEHLAGCDECRQTVALLADGATALAYTAEGPAPPAELRERILAAARAERATVVPIRRRFGTRWTAAAVAAAASLAIGLGLWATLGGSGGSRARESQTIALSGASGRLQVDRVGHAVLTVDHVARAPSGKAYEAWVIPSGKAPERAGLFSGGGRVSVRLGPRVPAGSMVAVTVERAGGVDAPTGKIRFRAFVAA